jgi:serralysin
MAPAPWTNDQIIAQIDSGYHWWTTTVTFGFPTSAPSWASAAEGPGFSAFNPSQKAAARLAMQLWDDVTAIDFVEVAAGSNPRITLQNTTTAIGYAHAYYPGNWDGAGSVWTNPSYSDLATPVVGDYGFMALVHEIGHALGLSHPGTYNGGAPTYNKDALYEQDTHQYTVMSYFSADNTGADWWAGDGKWRYPQTPMLHDIMTIQAIYGAETSTRTGDTTYGFNSTADRSVFDFTQNTHPILTIWDAGGIDTIDLSGFSSASNLSLVEGAYSDADNMTQNIAIAYGAEIENAVGGSGNDTLTGNALANRLAGNGGNDSLDGAGGNDTLVGGAGNDTLKGGTGNDTADYSGHGGALTVRLGTTATQNTGAAGSDVLSGIESATGGAGNDSLTGSAAANLLQGGGGADKLAGLGGNDTLLGGAGSDNLRAGDGADLLSGGAARDVLRGNAGADTFQFSDLAESGVAGSQRDVVRDFAPGIDTVDLSGIDADSLLAGDQAFAFIGAGPFSGAAGELRYVNTATKTIVHADVDGDGGADFAMLFNGILAFQEGDFTL